MTLSWIRLAKIRKEWKWSYNVRGQTLNCCKENLPVHWEEQEISKGSGATLKLKLKGFADSWMPTMPRFYTLRKIIEV